MQLKNININIGNFLLGVSVFLVIIPLLTACSGGTGSLEYFVATYAGSGGNGSQENPFESLHAALEKIRTLPESEKNQDINIVLEEDVIDQFIERLITGSADTESMYRQLTQGFEHGLKLVRDKTGKNRFFITKQAIIDPDGYVTKLLKDA